GALEIPPGEGFQALAEMEKRGLVQQTITRRIFGLPERAGCKNVINLHGSVNRNYCPHCKREFTIEEIRNAKHVPLCPDCGTVIRPEVVLFGEQVDNAVMTRAAKEIEKAEVLLVLGTKLNSNLCSQLLKYYTGNKLILVTLYPHFSDKMADYVINRRVDETLKELLAE
ncbi:MAG TPA: NAD-dependent deacetylase, partial [Lachnospiraceae bacterium]|nr:NAD-dependent deacetylase [Lachnospiraceae bacterium]